MANPSGASERENNGFKAMAICLGLLVVILLLRFARSLNPSLVLFANDGPLGANMARCESLPQLFFGGWQDLNWLGGYVGSAPPMPTSLIRWWLGNIYFAKFYSPLCLLFLGLSAWWFFRQLRFAPVVCILGAIAAALNSNIFSNVCWGLGTRAITVGCVFLALGAVVNAKGSGWRPWVWCMLAGLALGIAIMEGADNGAIFSLYVAAFGTFSALAGIHHGGTENPEFQRELGSRGRSPSQGFMKGIARVAVVAIFAAFMATQALIGLLGVAKGLSTAQQAPEGPLSAWDRATQWSLPKVESLRVIIPGLKGYRMDTPDGGSYWGTVGMTPGWESHHMGIARYSGAGEYAGVLVVLIAIFAIVESFRKRESRMNANERESLTMTERRMVWFWAIAAFISLLLAWGRHAPFYRLVFALPYFSTIRNPIKFMHPFHLAAIVLFGYGLQALWRKYIRTGNAERGTRNAEKAEGQRLKAEVTQATRGARPSEAEVLGKLGNFEKRWTIGVAAAIAVSVLGWLVYANADKSVLSFLTQTGIPEREAAKVMGFSLREVGLYLFFLLVSAGLVFLIMRGKFSGARARWAGVLLGLVLIVDLARANTPWIKYYDYKEKYSTNPVIETLRQNSHEHRFVMPMLQLTREFQMLQQVYMVEWLQHHFQYYNVESLDVTQEPQGEPPDKAAFRKAFGQNLAKLWQMTNSRFLFWLPGQYLDLLNQQLDAGKNRFKLHSLFTVMQTPNEVSWTAETNNAGPFALVEFTGALPRAKLYSDWQVSADDNQTLAKVGNADFDPEKTVIVNSGTPNSQPQTPNFGTVEFVNYAPKRIQLRANAPAAAMLLLNDKYDPNWKVSVDGKAAPLLRANFTMRAVQVPQGQHLVEFRFRPPVTGLYVSLAAIAFGVVLIALLGFTDEKVAGTPLVPEEAGTARYAR